MAHFAQIENGLVTQVIVVSNAEILDANGIEQEDIGVAFCENLLGGTWKQTSYNGNIRKNYAGIGFTYDSQRDAFIAPKPYPSWTLAEETCQWVSPVAMPIDDNVYSWDESTISWVAT
jgi:hypothetical protein